MNTLNNEQRQAFDIMMEGNSVFLTGKAGSGKSYLLNTFISYCKKLKKNVLVCAPTGVAALNVHGVTLHRAFLMDFKPQIHNPKRIPPVIKNADILIIDEISMCRMDVFEYVIKCILYVKNKYHKQIQVIVVGDFYQLAPVMTRQDKEVLDAYYNRDIQDGFAFQSPLWKQCHFTTITLSYIFRQQDNVFIDALNKARIGDYRCIDTIYQNCSKMPIRDAIWLVGTNKVANQINERGLHSLYSPSHYYESDLWESNGFHLNETEKPTSSTLELRVGARIMILINHPSGLYSNGSLGTVVEMFDDSIDVKVDDLQKIVNIKYYTWNINKYQLVEVGGKKYIDEYTIASFTQIPVKLAYAITVHKSQGQTFTKVNYDPYSFSHGQLYVGLSRCTSLDNLYIHGELKREYMLVSDEVIDFTFDDKEYDFFEDIDHYIH